MRKSVLIAALGLMSLSAVAQDAPKNEGFVFTTVKENPGPAPFEHVLELLQPQLPGGRTAPHGQGDV